MKKRKLDRHTLYERSVQNPEFEVEFIQRLFRSIRGREATRLEEDFCGTAALCCEWVRSVEGGQALGLDLDRPTLDWGEKHNLGRLPAASRPFVELVETDVLDPRPFFADGGAPEVTVAFNFSYWVFKSRQLLSSYFRRVHRSLASDGVFVLDIYGGHEAQVVQEEATEHEGFDYVWDQASYNPLTGDYVCHIHFDIHEGERFKKAFTYEWRLWSLPEVRELLVEAGFREPIVYWEGDDDEGGGNGEYEPTTEGDDSSAWVAYIVAPK